MWHRNGVMENFSTLELHYFRRSPVCQMNAVIHYAAYRCEPRPAWTVNERTEEMFSHIGVTRTRRNAIE
jgi:hypothetical protein